MGFYIAICFYYECKWLITSHVRTIANDYIQSKSEFMRLMKQNGVSLNGEKLTVDDTDKVVMNDEVLQIGKKRFIRFIK